jgi:hypothetical protein
MPGLIRAVGRTAVVAGTATAVSNRVSRRQANRWSDQEQQQYEHEYYEQSQQAPPPQQPQQAPPPQQYAAPPPQYQEPAPPPAPVMVVQAPPPPPAPAEAAPDMSAKLAQLTQLGELKAAGILSDAEFEAQKQKILAS